MSGIFSGFMGNESERRTNNSGRSEKQDGHLGLWLAKTFLTSPLKLLNGIQRNLAGSKISTCSTMYLWIHTICLFLAPIHSPWTKKKTLIPYSNLQSTLMRYCILSGLSWLTALYEEQMNCWLWSVYCVVMMSWLLLRVSVPVLTLSVWVGPIWNNNRKLWSYILVTCSICFNPNPFSKFNIFLAVPRKSAMCVKHVFKKAHYIYYLFVHIMSVL